MHFERHFYIFYLALINVGFSMFLLQLSYDSLAEYLVNKRGYSADLKHDPSSRKDFM